MLLSCFFLRLKSFSMRRLLFEELVFSTIEKFSNRSNIPGLVVDSGGARVVIGTSAK